MPELRRGLFADAGVLPRVWPAAAADARGRPRARGSVAVARPLVSGRLDLAGRAARVDRRARRHRLVLCLEEQRAQENRRRDDPDDRLHERLDSPDRHRRFPDDDWPDEPAAPAASAPDSSTAAASAESDASDLVAGEQERLYSGPALGTRQRGTRRRRASGAPRD